MKKFKHKKLDKTATKFSDDFYTVDGGVVIPSWAIVNSEDWEELVEKTYEVLTVKSPYGPLLLEGECVNSYIGMSGYEINSVKRLSDGEIFTVGDKVNYSYLNSNSNTITKNYFIKKIYFINKNRISIYVGEGLNLGIKSLVKPLFTTEDGVEIFRSDLCIGVRDDFTSYQVNTIGDSHCKHKLTFSTQEKAEEYILMNKPCLSINDLIHIPSFLFGDSSIQKMKQAVKNKQHER